MSVLIKNKKAGLNYHILDKYSAGVILIGSEVKSIKNRNGSFEGSFISIDNGEVYLKSAYIPAWQEKNSNFDTNRHRKLLLNKREIKKLAREIKKPALTLIPLSFSLEKNLIKLKFALAQGKKKYDKRQDIKKSDVKRDLERTLKIRMK